MAIFKETLQFAEGDDYDIVGSKIIGSSSAVIDSSAIGGSDYLHVKAALFDETGTAFSSGNPLSVNIENASIVVTATDLDIRDLAHASDSVKLGDGTTLYTGTTVGSDHGLDVNIINASLDVNVGSPNSSATYGKDAMSSTAAEIAATAVAGRRWIILQNNGANDVYMGDDASVTTSAFGFVLRKKSNVQLEYGDALDLFGITAAGAADINWFQAA